MQNQKGITLIALVITVIVMLILTGVTISLTINGGLIDKAREAAFKTKLSQMVESWEIYKTQQYAQGEEVLDSLSGEDLKDLIGGDIDASKLEVLNGTIRFKGEGSEQQWADGFLQNNNEPEILARGKTYETIYINPNPPRISELDQDILDLLVLDEDDGNEYMYFSVYKDGGQATIRINPQIEGEGWNLSTKNFIVSETEPSSPSEADYWFKESINIVYKYLTNAWVEQVGFIITDQEPETGVLGDLGVYTGNAEPVLMEYINGMLSPEGVLLFKLENGVQKMYFYVFSQEDASWANTFFGLTFVIGWNEMVLAQDGTPISATPLINLQILEMENANFNNYSESEFEIVAPYLGEYFQSIPW